MATVSSVEATAKTDVTAVETVAVSEFTKLKAYVVALEAKTFGGKTVLVAVGAALVVGVIVGHLL